MQRCRELFAAVMQGLDELVYDPEGNRLLLRGEEVTAESSSSEGDSGESEIGRASCRERVLVAV